MAQQLLSQGVVHTAVQCAPRGVPLRCIRHKAAPLVIRHRTDALLLHPGVVQLVAAGEFAGEDLHACVRVCNCV